MRPVERAGELREVHERMRARFLEQPYFRRFATRVAQVRDPRRKRVGCDAEAHRAPPAVAADVQAQRPVRQLI